MLEAGGEWYQTRDSPMMTGNWQSPRRGASTPARPFGEFDACDGGWQIDGEPYTVGAGSRFEWFRARMLGGRTNHWGRISLRFGPDDFRRKTLDGLGDDWPITYDDVAPYYDRVDRLIGIYGNRDGLPNDPDGIFMPPPKPRCYELLVKKASDRLGVTCVSSRMSILTQPLNGRQPCHYCGQCNRGCRTDSNFSSPTVLIQPALATGRLRLITGAMAREVTVDARGLASGVSYIDTRTGVDEHIAARVVVVAASACESARLLLNSKSAHFPDGLANSSGTVGRYLTDTTGVGVSGYIPALVDHPVHNEDGAGMHVMMPWWLDNRRLDFPRGYHIEVGGGRRMPGYGFMGGIHRYPRGGGWGESLKEDYRRYWGATISFAGRGEMIPNDQTYCEIDPTVVDRYGIPALRFHFQWSDHEINQVRHMQQTFRSLIAEMGGEVFTPMPTREQGYGILNGGVIIHELGVARMGADPSASVLNGHSQAHDVRNLFVADAASFVTQPDKNPTWTIMALSMRASDYITEQMKAGAL
jgi:choline dehydrogenase-like flavoprotein